VVDSVAGSEIGIYLGRSGPFSELDRQLCSTPLYATGRR